MLNLDSYWEKITAKFLDGTCTHHGLPAGGILFTFYILPVSSAIFFVVFMLTSSRRVCNQQLDLQAAAIGLVCLAGFAQALQHVFGTHQIPAWQGAGLFQRPLIILNRRRGDGQGDRPVAFVSHPVFYLVL